MRAPAVSGDQIGRRPHRTIPRQRVVSPRRWPNRKPVYDTVVSGAGVAGSMLGACLARQGGQRVLMGDPARSIDTVLDRPALGLDLADLLDHPQIDVLLDIDRQELQKAYPDARFIPAQPLDEYFAERAGKADAGILRDELAQVVEVLLCDLQPALDVLTSAPGSSSRRR